jgi:hypothetical protein
MSMLSRMILLAVLAFGLAPPISDVAADSLRERATQILGRPLPSRHEVYSLGGNWVIWLVEDTDGNLIEADVGPKSYYVDEFPNAAKQPDVDFLSKEEYRHAI